MKTNFPGLNLLLIEEKTSALVLGLVEGQMDCALLAMPVVNDHLEGIRLFEEPFMLAVGIHHPLAKRKLLSIEDLKGTTMLLLDEGHCLRDQALMVCQSIGLGEAKNFRATSLETLRHMVAAGNAVTLMPRLAIQTDNPHLRYIPFKQPVPSRVIGLYWRKTSARISLYKAIEEKLFPGNVCPDGS